MRRLVPRFIAATLAGILTCTALLAEQGNTAHLASSGAVLAFDDFEDGDPLPWLTFASGWQESGGVFHATNTSANTPVSAVWEEGFAWSDVVVEAEVTPLTFVPPPSESGIVFRFQEPHPENRYCYCGLFHFGSFKVRLRCGDGGLDPIEIEHPLSAGNTYLLRASAIGSELSCEIVGEPATRITATAPGLWSTGTAGLRSTHIPSDYDNFLVTSGHSGSPFSRVLFDDFGYDCVDDCPGMRALFGENLWEGATAPFTQRFWNSDGAIGDRSLDPTGNGILALRLPQGFDDSGANDPGAGSELTPRIASPIKFNTGTYAARIAFDGSTLDDQVVQTFFLISPASCDPLYAEVDFEFYSSEHRIEYVIWETTCDPSVHDDDPLVAGGWMDLIMRVEADEAVTFELYDTSGTQLVDGWSVMAPTHLPEAGSRMGIFFNIWLVVGAPPITQEHELLIDWVMHVEGNPNVSWTALSGQLSTLRASGIERLDTTPLFADGFESGDLRYWQAALPASPGE